MMILGLDPGFANLGWCRASYTNDAFAILEMGCIQTKKDGRKVLQSVDNVRRARAITLELRDLVWQYAGDGEPVRIVDAIALEAMSFPRNASSASKMSMTWGVISALSGLWDIPMIQASPQDIKEAVVGSRKASKGEMEATLSGRYPEVLKCLEGIPMGRREHPYDALGAIVASLGSEVVKMGLRQ
jgi:Holliday junction resolvasome RuvABC endonuclease subunit